jgi:hypothetical protein
MNDMKFNGDQYLKEKGGLSLSVVKSLVRREKEERSSSEFYGDDETKSLMYSLFKFGMFPWGAEHPFLFILFCNSSFAL